MKTKERAGITVFSFGAPANIRSNRALSKIAMEKAHKLKAPIFTQLDIKIEDSTIETDYVREKPGNPPPTLLIAQGAVKWAKRKEITDLWIIAARPHLWRCMRDLAYARRASVEIQFHICNEIYEYSDIDWFCVNSVQKRTQSREEWEKRERLIKRMPFSIYRLVSR